MVNAVCSRLSTHDVPFPHLRPLPLAPYDCGWMQTIITDNYARENTSAVRRREKKKKMKSVQHFQVHSQSCETFLVVDVNNLF